MYMYYHNTVEQIETSLQFLHAEGSEPCTHQHAYPALDTTIALSGALLLPCKYVTNNYG